MAASREPALKSSRTRRTNPRGWRWTSCLFSWLAPSPRGASAATPAHSCSLAGGLRYAPASGKAAPPSQSTFVPSLSGFEPSLSGFVPAPTAVNSRAGGAICRVGMPRAAPSRTGSWTSGPEPRRRRALDDPTATRRQDRCLRITPHRSLTGHRPRAEARCEGCNRRLHGDDLSRVGRWRFRDETWPSCWGGNKRRLAGVQKETSPPGPSIAEAGA